MSFRSQGKEVSLSFRGFSIDAREIEQILGVEANEVGKKGDNVRPGTQTVLKRSFARFSVALAADARLDQAIPAIIDHLGGVENLIKAFDIVLPEFFEINIVWPIKFSRDQEGGFFPPVVLRDLSRLRCSLAFSFL